MNKYWVHPEDYEIVEDPPDKPYRKIVMDCDGETLLIVDAEWPDEHIHAAMRLANRAHADGVKKGRSDAQRQIREAMGLKMGIGSGQVFIDFS